MSEAVPQGQERPADVTGVGETEVPSTPREGAEPVADTCTSKEVAASCSPDANDGRPSQDHTQPAKADAEKEASPEPAPQDPAPSDPNLSAAKGKQPERSSAELDATVSAPSEANHTEATRPMPMSTRAEHAPQAAHVGGAGVPQPVAPKPFDFNRFLEQMKHRSAVPVNEYVRSFFRGFTKRPYKPADQVKLIFDFLDFISERMAEADVWARLSDADFDQATEAMEKLIMNRLYTYTFTPALEQEGHWSVQTNDLERDQVLSQRIRLLSWVSERQLDVPTGTHSARFSDFAAQELCKVNHYRAPRDKIICILNCCKVIFGLIRHLDQEENADAFMPLLILVILRANPPHLVSNVEYILRFKNPNRPTSEADYYLSSLSGAISFIESMDHTALSHVSQEEYDAHVQRAAAELEAEAAAQDAPLNAQLAAVSLADDARAFLQRTSEAARAGITSSLSGPMGALGKLLYERIDDALTRANSMQTPAPRAPRAPQRGAAPNAPIRPNSLALLDEEETRSEPDTSPYDTPRRSVYNDASDSPSRHVSAAQRANEASDDTSVDWDAGTQTLRTIFPQAEETVLVLVLQECGGNVETAIDRLLEMT